MTSPPIGTDKELIVRLRKYGHIEAANALLSRIAEVERLTERVNELEAALRPFAAHVGKNGSWVELKIGESTWTNTLSTDDFAKARAALSLHGKV